MKRFLEESVKKIFNICVFTIHKRGRRRTTLAEVIDHVLALSFKPKTVIDVGVAEGTFELYRFQGARYLLIEPLKEFEPILKSICRKYPGEYVLAAASDKSGSITLYVHDNLSSSSILKERDSSFVNGVP